MYAGSEFMPNVQAMLWDGCRHMFSTKTFGFPTGLTDRIAAILHQFNVPYTVIPPQVEIHPIVTPPLGLPLRCYQRDALDTAHQRSRGIIKIPTGGGKTLVYSGLIAEKKVPTVILVHRQELLYQTQTRIHKDLGVPLADIGLIGDGHHEIKDITVAMIQTLMFNLGLISKEFKEKDQTKCDRSVFDHFNMLISDEVHVLGASVFFKVAKCFRNTLYRFGGSATPYRENANLLIESAIGPVIYSKTIGDLKGKFLADVDVYFFDFKHSPVAKHLDYKQVYEQEIVQNSTRNALIKRVVEKCGDKRVLIAVRTIAHGKLLNDLIPGTVFVHGSLSSKHRQSVMKDFEEGKIKRVITTVIWEQGIDIPSLETLVDVRAEKSAIGFIQLIGRVMRKTDIKGRAVVIDIFDTGCRWLSSHARERMEIATQEIGNVHLVKSS